MRLKKVVLVSVLCLIFFSYYFPVRSQTSRFDPNSTSDEEEKDNYIFQELAKTLKGPVEMGWLVPPHTLFMDHKRSQAYIYSSLTTVLKAKYLGPVGDSEIKKMEQKYGMLCDTDETYYKYRVEGLDLKQAERVFVAAEPLPGAKLGFKKINPTQDMLDKARKALGSPEVLHKFLFLQTLDGKFVYSFHAFYHQKSKEIAKYGMVLQDGNGVVLAKTSRTVPKNVEWCDGCDTPAYKDPLSWIYDPVNLLETSAFPFPVILMNTPGGEGAALSLVTFDSKGSRSEIRAYEYDVHCQ